MINTSDISKNFILNKAVHDATNILLRPYMSVRAQEPCTTFTSYEDKYATINEIKEKWISYSHDFLLKMTTIAWDFITFLNMFQNNFASQLVTEDILENDI